MKKVLALVMMLCLLCTAALAEDSSSITWADVEPKLAEMGLTGDFVLLETLGLKIWLPESLKAVEVSETDAAAGRLYLFMADDQSAYLAVDAMNVPDMTIDQYFENAKASEKVSGVEMVTTNGLSAVVYQSEEVNAWYACLVDSNSNVINFVMGPASEEGSQAVFSLLMASLQPAE